MVPRGLGDHLLASARSFSIPVEPDYSEICMEIIQPSLTIICCNCFGFVSTVVKNSQVSYFPGNLRQTFIKDL